MAIADRAKELLSRDLQLWELRGTPMQMIESGVRAHLRWLSEHRNLYRYLNRHSRVTLSDEHDPITDVKTAIGRQLTVLLETYHEAFGLDVRTAQPSAFGIVGMVDSAAAHWLDDPHELAEDELTSLLSGWVWVVLESNLRIGGVELSPHDPIGAPDLSDAPKPPEMRRPSS